MSCNPCGNGMGGLGSVALISVPFQLVSAGTGGTGGGGTGGGAATGIAYAPQNGSVLSGKTNVGTALDSVADLLKLLNNAGFANAADGTIPVYDAATGKLIPTPASSLLAPADLAALLKTLYASGQPGAMLQIAPNGDVAAVPFLQAVKAGTPGATAGQILKFDGTNWVLAADATGAAAASLNSMFAALAPGTLAKVVGLDAAGNAITQTPAGVVGAGIAAAPAATVADPLTKVSGVDAAGQAVTQTPSALVGGAVTASPAATTANPIAQISGVDAAGNPVKATPLNAFEAAVLAAPASTAAAKLDRVSGVTATGAAVDAAVREVGTQTIGQSTATSTVLPGAGNVVLTSVIAPVAGLYSVDIDTIMGRTLTAATTFPSFSYLGHSVVIINETQGNAMLYHSGTIAPLTASPGQSLVAGTDLGIQVNRGTVWTGKLAAGDKLRLEINNSHETAGITLAHFDPANINLTKLADTDLVLV